MRSARSESVTHVSGTGCHLCLGPLIKEIAEPYVPQKTACGTQAEREIGLGSVHEILLASLVTPARRAGIGSRPFAQLDCISPLFICDILRYPKIDEEVKNNRYRESREKIARPATGWKIGGNALV
jgi:hypothetical protein